MRVVLVGWHGLLGDIVASTLASDPDVEVVATLAAGPLDPDLDAVRADVVLWNEADEASVARWLGALRQRCVPRVLATSGDGRMASLWELTPQRSELGDLSPSALLDALRAAGPGAAEEAS